jgi:DNA polymerase III delta prime subunit
MELSQSNIFTGAGSDVLKSAAEAAADALGERLFIDFDRERDDKKIAKIDDIYRLARARRDRPMTFIIDADSFFATVTNDPWQNHFLKLFEEPNENVYLIILTTNLENLLPTIRSRAAIHKIAPKNGSTKIVKAPNAKVARWFDSGEIEKMKIIAGLKTRNDAISFVRELAEIVKNDPGKIVYAPAVAATLDRLIHNGNVKVQMTNLALNT